MTNHRKRRVRDMTAIYCGKRKGKRYEIMKVNSCHIPPLPFTPVPSRSLVSFHSTPSHSGTE